MVYRLLLVVILTSCQPVKEVSEREPVGKICEDEEVVRLKLTQCVSKTAGVFEELNDCHQVALESLCG